MVFSILIDKNQMCFQHTKVAPTEHLFYLRPECIVHKEVEHGYHWLISLELSKLIEELKRDNFQWMKQEIFDEDDECN